MQWCHEHQGPRPFLSSTCDFYLIVQDGCLSVSCHFDLPTNEKEEGVKMDLALPLRIPPGFGKHYLCLCPVDSNLIIITLNCRKGWKTLLIQAAMCPVKFRFASKEKEANRHWETTQKESLNFPDYEPDSKFFQVISLISPNLNYPYNNKIY